MNRFFSVCSGGCTLLLAAAAFAQPQAITNEFQVNTGQVNGNQDDPACAMDAAGNFVIVWESNQNPNGDGIFAQRYDAAANPVGGEFQVNNSAPNNQNEPDVGMAGDGRFIIVYEAANNPQSPAGSGDDIYGRLYDAMGNATGNEFLINKNTPLAQRFPATAMANSGAFVVAWQSQFQNAFGTGTNLGIRALRFNSMGGVLDSDEIVVNTTGGGDQADPEVAVQPNGMSFVIVWEGEGEIIHARKFNADGTAATGEIQVNTPATGNSQGCPAVAVGPNGGFIVAWEANPPGPGGLEVWARAFNPAGNPLGGAFMVNTTTTGAQEDPEISVRVDMNGNFVIVWESTQSGSESVRGQYFNMMRQPVGGQFLINETFPDDQDDPAVAMSPGGNFIVAWESRQDENGGRNGGDASDDGVFARLFGPPPMGPGPMCDISGIDTVCPGDTGLVFSVSSGSAGATFEWSIGMGGDASIVGSNTGSSVTVDVDDMCGGFTLNVTVTANGQTGMCTHTVMVEDTTNPVVVAPDDATVECSDPTDPTATGTATATDNCPAGASVSFNDASVPGCGNTEVITRTWTATDVCGNMATATQTITVLDRTNPTIMCPPDITVGPRRQIDPIDTGEPTGMDSCGMVTFDFVDVSVEGICPIAEVITRTWTATDACGNTASCDQIIMVEDECIWDNRGWDGIAGQTSERDTSVDESYTADDFTLKEGFVYRMDQISVLMITNSNLTGSWAPPAVELSLYTDCNGCPTDDLVDCGFFPHVRDITVLQDLPGPGGFKLVRVNWDTGERLDPDTGETIPGLWLKGGTYWVSPVGLGDGTGQDNWWWATSGTEIQGAIAKSKSGDFKLNDWEPVSELNVGCRDFAFNVCATPCCIGWDQNEVVQQGLNGTNTTDPGCRDADNFAVAPCENRQEICYFSAYVVTNCDPCRSKLEIHADDCGSVGSLVASEVQASKCTLIFDDSTLPTYLVEWHDLGIPVEGGRNYWASVHVQGTGAFNEIGFWSSYSPCDSNCDVKISEGQFICPADDVNEWTDVGHDFAFCIGIDRRERMGGGMNQIGPPPTGATETCAGDFDGNGTADVTDLLGFLDVWFEGCD